jgi:hypothetical protein
MSLQCGAAANGRVPVVAVGHVSLRGASCADSPMAVVRRGSLRSDRAARVLEPGKARMVVVPSSTSQRVMETCHVVYPHAMYADLRLMADNAVGDAAIMVRSTAVQPFVTVRTCVRHNTSCGLCGLRPCVCVCVCVCVCGTCRWGRW